MKSNKIGYDEGNGRIDEDQKRNGEWADGEQVSECLQAGRSKQSPLKSHHCRIIWIMLQSRVLRVPVWLIARGEFPGKVPTLIVVIVWSSNEETSKIRSCDDGARRRSHDTPSIRLNGNIKIVN